MHIPSLLIAILTLCLAERSPTSVDALFQRIDVTHIPADTIDASRGTLALDNGMYSQAGHPFSGYVRESYADGTPQRVASYYLGKQHGLTTTFYANGTPRDVRSYKDNVGYGRHFGYWENGHIKFDFRYRNDKREGVQKQWYRSGKPYAFLAFRDDKEAGMQQAWRESGSLYINYEARDGIRYGLQKSVLCATIENGVAR